MLLCIYLQVKESVLSQFVGLRLKGGRGGVLAKGNKKGLSEHLELLFSKRIKFSNAKKKILRKYQFREENIINFLPKRLIYFNNLSFSGLLKKKYFRFERFVYNNIVQV